MQTQAKRVTPEEYLELERKSDVRSEYRNGEIVEMTRGTIDYNRIAGNVYAFLKYALRGKGAEPFFGI